jgi:2'-5' RNA ligase
VRLFVAVELDDALRQAAIAEIADLRAIVARDAPRARVTWLSAERLHLTLAFIGHVDVARLPDIQEALRPPCSLGRFEILVRGIGVFPDRGRPRVIWAGITDGRDQLVALAGEVAARLGPAGIAREDRAYQPHLTLARVKDPGDLRAPVVTGGRGQPVLGTSLVRAITLFESRLSPKGPEYRAIERTALQ